MQAPEAAHERQRRCDLRESRIRGPGGGEINNPATLWGERGLSREIRVSCNSSQSDTAGDAENKQHLLARA
ncbi:hypothetical protein NDU88_004628 [Pleurodeles waltl]|uniref:Uncharacterized protein n=1 Tax=Pleurodeles waltl TaxID=8319 RepID=A0AAV7VKY1_PLEWA|nr:hypothetical protein NDU88_004628 [Pleurodeles waltl]